MPRLTKMLVSDIRRYLLGVAEVHAGRLLLRHTIGAKIITLHNLFFRIYVPSFVMILINITELVWNYFPSYVMSCVVAKHTMWTSDYIPQLFLN